MPNDEEVIADSEEAFIDAYLAECRERQQAKAQLREKNLNAAANRPEEAFFSKLDSNLRKNTAFVKKLKTITEAQRDSLMRDMTGLNLTKYISEAAASIIEAKLKMSDIQTAVQVCSALHQRYAEFSTQLLENWQKVLPLKKDDKNTNLSKTRVDLRFFAELVSCGVFTQKEGLPVLRNLLTFLTTSDREDHSNLSILLSFCRHCGDDFAGLLPRKVRLLCEKHGRMTPTNDFLTVEKQKSIQSLLKEYFRQICRHLQRDHKNLQVMERHNRRVLQTKGELSAEQKEKCEAAHLAFQKLSTTTQQLAELLDEDMPDLPMEEMTTLDNEGGSLDVHNRFKGGELDATSSLWEDEDSRSFYENLPDLKAFIPGILYKDSAQVTNNVPPLEEASEASLEEDLQKLEIEGIMEVEVEKEGGKEEKDLTETLLQEIEAPEEQEAAAGGPGVANKLLLDSFLTSLLHCVNREMVDQAAIQFCMNLNTKPNRIKLVRALFLVPRTRLDLLPFYARLVATLNPCMPDVANELVGMLKQDFKFHIKKKDQINIESKVKSVRFIGELVKFSIFPKSEALFCLKMLLLDFMHHYIEMACNLLETCGRFLFRSPDSHHRTKVYLEQMMRKKAVQALDSRYTTMIENAFYYCNPPETPAVAYVARPPLHQYIRKLLYKDLAKSSTEKVLRQMRKLDWENPDVAAYATRCLTAIWNVKYYNIRCVANLLAGLVAYQETVGPQVVDGVLEDIRLGMEVNHPKYNQRRVSMVHYLGELYNYRMVESSVIFKVLYSFITLGVNLDGSPSDLDPPDHLFRIRLVCILLETCGQYFNTGSSKKKLDCFIVFFQRYYWQKRSSEAFGEEVGFPVTVDYLVKDTLLILRPKTKLAENLEEAVAAVESLLSELKPKLPELLSSVPANEPGDQGGKQARDADVLGPIQEVEEDPDEDNHSIECSDQETEVDVDTDPLSNSQSQPLYDDLNMSSDEDHAMVEGTSSQDALRLVQRKPKHIVCTEDEDFMTAFDKMLSESLLHRNQEAVKPQADIVIPMSIRGGTQKKVYASIDKKMEEEKSTMNFILMTRKGHKPQFKSLEVPVSSELAQNLRDREEAERVEKEQVKMLTLNINERQEEEDYQEMLAAQQRPVVLNLNRDRRHKYQHPKGAPDADVIFGNKKR
ncbi:regulator of nonsense transcripts 2-like isoform X2 [Ornithodoros turicata]|uniref:regulator of nonsense transcripts 2-like isoform X2 n=1 Tax=Ornithodoros turicata TaxID=34597 RepID=UPI003138FADE